MTLDRKREPGDPGIPKWQIGYIYHYLQHFRTKSTHRQQW